MKKKTWKKVIALFAAFVMLLTAIPTYAKKQMPFSVELSKNLILPFQPPFNHSNKLLIGTVYAMSPDKVTVKSSNPKIAIIEKEDETGNDTTLSATPVKPGKATFYVTPKGKKTYTVKVTVVKYQNPISYIKIGNTTITGSAFDKTGNVNLSYDKFKGKNVRFIMKAMNSEGWQIQKHNIKAYNYSKNYYKELGRNGTFKLCGKKGDFQIGMYLKNPKKNLYMYLTITFK